MPSIIRYAAGKMLMLDFLIGIGGIADSCTIRVYSKDTSQAYLGRVFFEGDVWNDIGQDRPEKEQKEVYKLIDLAFPELIGYGMKQQGYAKYSRITVDNAIKP